MRLKCAGMVGTVVVLGATSFSFGQTTSGRNMERFNKARHPKGLMLVIPGDLMPRPDSPAEGMRTRNPRPEFSWSDAETNSIEYCINVFRGDPRVTPVEPVTFCRIFDYSFTVPVGSELAPGTYFWELIGLPNPIDFYAVPYRELTILCPADFNEDFAVDFFDYLDFTVAFSNDEPSADFNRDQVVDFFDYLDFVVAFQDPCEV